MEFTYNIKRYNDYPNSFLMSTILNRDLWPTNFIPEKDTPDDRFTNNLSLVSALYLYTNPPPYGYGSQGPKVAETIIRSYGFNKKKSNKKLKINDFEIERLNWEEEDGQFPHDVTHGNYNPYEVKKMAMNFLIQNYTSIDMCVKSVINDATTRSADILTKGRQTLCGFTGQSVTAAVAYRRMYDFYRSSLNISSFNWVEWIKAFFDILEMNQITTLDVIEKKTTRTRYNRVTKQRQLITTTKKTMGKTRTSNIEETRKRMLDFSRSFASYIKHKERGKLKRRAIASANMVLRMFLHIIEELHLRLGKNLPGSTISIGGEEKKSKIKANLDTAVLVHYVDCFKSQGTEDATKWNECLSPSAFCLMHKVFFDPEVRTELDLPEVSREGALFYKIARAGHFIMSIKRIQMGPGIQAINENVYNRLSWKDAELSRFNEQTKEMLENCRHLIDNDNYIFASPGMLMGMLNAASTTYGLIAENYEMGHTRKVQTLRSSDDSMSVYIGSTEEECEECMVRNYVNLSLLGINLSKGKTLIFEKGYGEYNSWYLDGDFMVQFGVEVSTLRPQGKNPPDDFYAISKGTAVNLQTLQLNAVGATCKLKIGVDSIRRLYRIRYNPTKRPGISSKVLLLSDGGDNLWDCSNCHLEETSLKGKFATSQEEKDYLLRIRNPDCPLAAPPEEEITYNKDSGGLMISTIETPRTAFHFVKRSNRTATNTIKKNMFDEEKANSEALKIVQHTDPGVLMGFPTQGTYISNQLISQLCLLKSDVELDDQETAEFHRAIGILRHGVSEDQDENGEGRQEFYTIEEEN